MKKIIIFFGTIPIVLGLSIIIVRTVLGDNDEVQNATNYIVVKGPLVNGEIIGKTEYPEMNYKYLDDTNLSFFVNGWIYVERTGNFQFFVDEDCKNPISVDPVFISSEIIKCEDSYAVLAEGNRILYFPVGGEIPHLISFEQTR